MNDNILFNFIEHYREESISALGSGVALIPATNREGHRYWRIELAKTTVEGSRLLYTLRDHHISIFAKEHRDKAELSQYHYTGHFKDREGQDYQLHIYFDGEDNIATKPDFRTIIRGAAGEETRIIDLSALDDAYLNTATSHSLRLIGALRHALTDTIHKQEENLLTLEARAIELSKNIATRPEEYLSVLEAMSRQQKSLIALTPLGSYAAQNKLLDKMIAAMHKNIRETSAAAIVVSGAEETVTVAEKIASLAPTACKTVTTAAKEACSSDLQISKWAKMFSTLKTEDGTQRAGILHSIESKIYELSLDDAKDISIAGLEQLRALHQAIREEGASLFHRLVHEKNTDGLKKLGYFTDLLTEAHLAFALLQNNAQLLDFITQHLGISLDKTPLKIGDTVYASALHYCFATDSEHTPRAQLLGVLVKNGASLLTKDEKGLPFAHRLFIEPTHPLSAIFQDEKIGSKTRYCPLFYQQLLTELRDYLKKTSLSKVQEDALKEQITLHKSILRGLESFYLAKSFYSKADKVAKAGGLSPEIMALETDEELNNAHQSMLKARNIYIRKLTRAEQLTFERREAKGMEENLKELEESAALSHLTAEQRKEYCLSRVNILREVYTLWSEIHDNNQQIKSRCAKKTADMLANNNKALNQRLAELEKEMKEKEAAIMRPPLVGKSSAATAAPPESALAAHGLFVARIDASPALSDEAAAGCGRPSLPSGT